MRLMICGAAVAATINSSVPAVAASTAIVTTYLETGGTAGRGLLVRGPSGCVILTAAHVLASGQDVDIQTSDGSILKGRRGAQHPASDAAVVVALSVGAFGNQACSGIPRPEAIEAALQGNENAVVAVAGGGQNVSFIPVSVTKAGNNLIEIRPKFPAQQLTQTMSGAPVIIGKTPVAIFQKIDTTIRGAPGIALRINQIVSLIGRPYLDYSDAEKFAAFKPNDISILPEKYQLAVKEARELKDAAENAALRAFEIAALAESIVTVARSGSRRKVVNGTLNAVLANQSIYYGQGFANGDIVGIEGIGAIETTGGADAGERLLCRFSRYFRCQDDIGYYYFPVLSIAKPYWKAWAGGIQNGKPHGAGQLVPADPNAGKIWYTYEVSERKPGVVLDANGELYEGQILGGRNGLGVLWDAKGNLIRYGQWENNVIKVDESKSVR